MLWTVNLSQLGEILRGGGILRGGEIFSKGRSFA